MTFARSPPAHCAWQPVRFPSKAVPTLVRRFCGRPRLIVEWQLDGFGNGLRGFQKIAEPGRKVLERFRDNMDHIRFRCSLPTTRMNFEPMMIGAGNAQHP